MDDITPRDKPASRARRPEVATKTTRVAPGSRKERTSGRELSRGFFVGEYRICRTLGRGGSGTVYMAEHKTRGDRVAVKVLHPGLAASARQVQRFAGEVKALQMIRHPSIVNIHDSDTLLDGRPYLVMELIQGETLAELVARQGRFTAPETLAMLVPVCEALAQVHEAGIVHRDIKASNIMRSGPAHAPRLTLLDFGIAKLINGDAGSAVKTSMGMVIGSPYSMAPEQILQKPVDARTDIYALGVLAYHLLTAEYPFEARDSQAISQLHLEAPPPRPSRRSPISPRLDEVILKALEKNPQNRYQSVPEFLEKFREALGEEGAAPRQRVPAFAIYVEGRVAADVDMDDGILLDLMNIIDMADEVFTASDVHVFMHTSHAMLGVLIGRDDAELARARALDIAAEMVQVLAGRAANEPRVLVNILLHRGDAWVFRAGERWQIAGGEVVNVGSWAPDRDLGGAYGSAAFSAVMRDAADDPWTPLALPARRAFSWRPKNQS